MESNLKDSSNLQFSLPRVAAFLGILFLMSCNVTYTKKEYLEDFSSFINRVNKDSKNYTKEKWIAVDQEFEKYAKEQYEKFRAELTKEELSTVGNLKAIYSTVKIRQSTKDELDKVRKLFDQVKSIGGGSDDPTKN